MLYACYEKLQSELLKVGVTKSIYDSAVFFWRQNGKLQGLLCCHVDDCFFVGSSLFHYRVIDHIRETFSLSKESHRAFNFLGLNISQKQKDILIHQDDYINSIKPIHLDDWCKMRPLTQTEKRQLKSLVGSTSSGYQNKTRPDIAYAACNH